GRGNGRPSSGDDRAATDCVGPGGQDWRGAVSGDTNYEPAPGAGDGSADVGGLCGRPGEGDDCGGGARRAVAERRGCFWGGRLVERAGHLFCFRRQASDVCGAWSDGRPSGGSAGGADCEGAAFGDVGGGGGGGRLGGVGGDLFCFRRQAFGVCGAWSDGGPSGGSGGGADCEGAGFGDVGGGGGGRDCGAFDAEAAIHGLRPGAGDYGRQLDM